MYLLDGQLGGDSQGWFNQQMPWQANDFELASILLQDQDDMDFGNMTVEELTDQLLHAQNYADSNGNGVSL